MIRHRTTALTVRTVVAAMVMAVSAACSSGTPPVSETPADAVVIEVSAVEYDFILSDTPTTPGTYTFDVTNDGAMSHDLVIWGPDGGAGTEVFGPGESASVTIKLVPGEYTIYCSVGNHREQGMEVTFTVT